MYSKTILDHARNALFTKNITKLIKDDNGNFKTSAKVLAVACATTGVVLTVLFSVPGTLPCLTQPCEASLLFQAGTILVARPVGLTAAYFSKKLVRHLHEKNYDGVGLKLAKGLELICDNPLIPIVAGYAARRFGTNFTMPLVGFGLGLNDFRFATDKQITYVPPEEYTMPFRDRTHLGRLIYLTKNYWETVVLAAAFAQCLIFPDSYYGAIIFGGGGATFYARKFSKIRLLPKLPTDISSTERCPRFRDALAKGTLAVTDRIYFDSLALSPIMNIEGNGSIGLPEVAMTLFGIGLGIAKEKIKSGESDIYRPKFFHAP